MWNLIQKKYVGKKLMYQNLAVIRCASFRKIQRGTLLNLLLVFESRASVTAVFLVQKTTCFVNYKSASM